MKFGQTAACEYETNRSKNVSLWAEKENERNQYVPKQRTKPRAFPEIVLFLRVYDYIRNGKCNSILSNKTNSNRDKLGIYTVMIFGTHFEQTKPVCKPGIMLSIYLQCVRGTIS